MNKDPEELFQIFTLMCPSKILESWFICKSWIDKKHIDNEGMHWIAANKVAKTYEWEVNFLFVLICLLARTLMIQVKLSLYFLLLWMIFLSMKFSCMQSWRGVLMKNENRKSWTDVITSSLEKNPIWKACKLFLIKIIWSKKKESIKTSTSFNHK